MDISEVNTQEVRWHSLRLLDLSIYSLSDDCRILNIESRGRSVYK